MKHFVKTFGLYMCRGAGRWDWMTCSNVVKRREAINS